MPAAAVTVIFTDADNIGVVIVLEPVAADGLTITGIKIAVTGVVVGIVMLIAVCATLAFPIIVGVTVTSVIAPAVILRIQS